MRLLRLIFSLALASAALPVASADAGFAPTNEEVGGGQELSATGFGMDAKGNALIAWDAQAGGAEPSEAKARHLAADGTLGPLLDLDPGQIAFEPRLGMTASGRAFVAWEREAANGANAGVRGRWVEPDGSLGPLITLIEGGVGIDANEPRVVVDPAGVATVSWENQMADTLSMRRVQPDSLFGTLVPDISGGAVTEHRTVALPNGSTVAVWDGANGIEKSVLTATLAFGAPEKISATAGSGIPAIAVDDLGNALVVWRQTGGADAAVRGRFLDPSGAPAGGEQTIDPLQAGSVGISVRAGADSAGDFVIAWTRGVATNTLFFARTAKLGGGFGGPAQPLSAGLASATAEQAAIFDVGGGAVAWENDISGEDVTFGRAIDAAGAPTGAIQPIFGDGVSATNVASAPAIGIATFLIEHPTGGGSEAVVARRFLLPPSCVDSTATVVEGRPVVIPLACTGAAIESATTLAAPQHGSVTFDRAALAFTYTPDPGFGGTDGFSYTGANDGGSSAGAKVTITVGRDSVKPRVQRLQLLKKVSKSDPPRFSKIRFKLAFSEVSTVRIAVQKRILVNGKPRFRGIGSVSTKQAALRATARVKGKLARKMAAGGRFRVRAVATDLARNSSKPRRLSFELG